MSKKGFLFIIIALFALTSISGCGFVADGPFGWVYTDTKGAIAMGNAESGDKVGKSCIHSFFGGIAVGDASIEAAMKDAGIKKVYTVNEDNLSIFGTYTRQCTLVSGL